MEIYTDGSSLGNNSNKDTPGGWAFVVVENNKESFHRCDYSKKATNNMMELQAMIEALMYLQFNKIENCIIYTDSNYVNMGLNIWSKKWVKNGFKSSTGSPVKNVEQWKGLIELKRKLPGIEIRWIKAHADNQWNNRADYLARTSAENIKESV